LTPVRSVEAADAKCARTQSTVPRVFSLVARLAVYPVLIVSFILLFSFAASGLAADVDLLALIPPDSRIVTIEKPREFRGTPLESHWQGHPFGEEYPMEAVWEVVSVFGIPEYEEEGFGLYILHVDPLSLRGRAARSDRIERVRDTDVLHFPDEDGRRTAILGGIVLIWGDADPVEAALELFRSNKAARLPLRVRETLIALRERTLTATWVMPPKYPYAPDGPRAVADRLEVLVDQAYSTLRWVDGWVESHEEFVAATPEDASRLAELIRSIVQMGTPVGDETQLGALLRRYHRNFGESAEVTETGNAVRLSVQLSPQEFEELRQEMGAESSVSPAP